MTDLPKGSWVCDKTNYKTGTIVRINPSGHYVVKWDIQGYGLIHPENIWNMEN